jgi:hypothetical protein
MILYVATSGGKRKVGITNNLKQRFAQYCCHNPDVELVEKVVMPEIPTRKLEALVHDILMVTDDEWLDVTEEQIDVAIEAGKYCLYHMVTAQKKIAGVEEDAGVKT